jgi:hypothetical protein
MPDWHPEKTAPTLHAGIPCNVRGVLPRLLLLFCYPGIPPDCALVVQSEVRYRLVSSSCVLHCCIIHAQRCLTQRKQMSAGLHQRPALQDCDCCVLLTLFLAVVMQCHPPTHRHNILCNIPLPAAV